MNILNSSSNNQVQRIEHALRLRAGRYGLVAQIKSSARWLLADFLGHFLVKHVAVDWGLGPRRSAPPHRRPR